MDIDYCRRRAFECAIEAQQMEVADDRRDLLIRMARHWLQLAEVESALKSPLRARHQ